MLHAPDLAEAILDRVLERGRFLHFRGPPYLTGNMHSQGRSIFSRNAIQRLANAKAG